ncbi:hypothetical protein C1J02_07590 [Sulfitobacter sp. SK011]|nr:hypothetical protein C1J02_07590 [Sulfitobacter sp. SK011]
MVSATSMIALEYLHPGVIGATGSTLEEVASLAGTSLTEGPQNFDEYMTAYAGRPTKLGSLRMFGEFQDSSPILEKFVPPANQISASGGNLLSDYFFEEPIAMDSKRSNPLGQLVSQAGMVAYNSGRPLTEQHTSQSPKDFQMNFLGDTPFSGIACTLCASTASETGDGVEAEYVSAPIFAEEFSVLSITAASPGNDNASGELVSGIDLMSSASSAAENSANSPSTEGQLVSSETKEKIACYAACGVAEVLTEGGDVAAESFKAAKDLLTGEGKDAWRENLDDVVEEVKDVTQIPNKCVETCENLDNPLDDDSGDEPQNGDNGNTDLTDNGNNGTQGDDGTDDDNGTTTGDEGTSTGDAVASTASESATAGNVASTSVPDDGGGCDPVMEGEGGCNCHADHEGMMLMPCTPDDGGANPAMANSPSELNFGQTRWLFRQPTQPDRIGSVFSVAYESDNPDDLMPAPVFTEIKSTGSGFESLGGNPIPNPGRFQGRVSSPVSIGDGISIPPNVLNE